MDRESGREMGKEDGKGSRKRRWEGKEGREGENRRPKKKAAWKANDNAIIECRRCN
jgi:hypothetical protein